MYTDMVPKISCQFLIGNVYLWRNNKMREEIIVSIPYR